MKKIVLSLLVLMLATTMTACQSNDATNKDAVIETFAAEYEMVGTTSAGKPKNDTFIFEGTTTDGIITELNFDIIRNKGLEGEYSKTDIMGYLMNVSDAEIVETENGFSLPVFSANGYNEAIEGAQFMLSASVAELTEETTFGDLEVILNSYTGSREATTQEALAAYAGIAAEANVELTEATLMSELLAAYGLYNEGFVAGKNRISFAGPNGGRSYGEQIKAITDYILANNMTLEQVYEMFKTENQITTPIVDRDTITGATISFVGDFQRMVYLAIYGELFEGVVNTKTDAENNTVYEVVVNGFGGEMEVNVTVNESLEIVTIAVRDDSETEGYGKVLTAQDSEFIQSLIAGQSDIENVDVATGATVTSNAMKKAVSMALEAAKAE